MNGTRLAASLASPVCCECCHCFAPLSLPPSALRATCGDTYHAPSGTAGGSRPTIAPLLERHWPPRLPGPLLRSPAVNWAVRSRGRCRQGPEGAHSRNSAIKRQAHRALAGRCGLPVAAGARHDQALMRWGAKCARCPCSSDCHRSTAITSSALRPPALLSQLSTAT